jgi:hypothetical protein
MYSRPARQLRAAARSLPRGAAWSAEPPPPRSPARALALTARPQRWVEVRAGRRRRTCQLLSTGAPAAASQAPRLPSRRCSSGTPSALPLGSACASPHSSSPADAVSRCAKRSAASVHARPAVLATTCAAATRSPRACAGAPPGCEARGGGAPRARRAAPAPPPPRAARRSCYAASRAPAPRTGVGATAGHVRCLRRGPQRAVATWMMHRRAWSSCALEKPPSGRPPAGGAAGARGSAGAPGGHAPLAHAKAASQRAPPQRVALGPGAVRAPTDGRA